MTATPRLTITQCRLLTVACAEPKTLGALLLDADRSPTAAGKARDYVEDLVEMGLFRVQEKPNRRLYAITPHGEQVADVVFDRVQAANQAELTGSIK